MFRTHLLIIRRSKLHYTASGIIIPIGVMIPCSYFMPLHVSSTFAHHQEVKIALHSLWYHHTYRCDDTRDCVMQFWPPDDEHMCSKHVEAWNKLIVKQKFCASSWLNTDIIHFTLYVKGIEIFQKPGRNSQNLLGPQDGEKEEHPIWGPKNIKRTVKKIRRHCDLERENCYRWSML